MVLNDIIYILFRFFSGLYKFLPDGSCSREYIVNLLICGTLFSTDKRHRSIHGPGTEVKKIMNIIDFALQMELDGKAHYEKLGEKTPVPVLKNLFSILAADEEKHYEVMKEMRSGAIIQMAGSIALETAQNIFQTIRLDEGILSELRTKLDAYRYAIKIEADSIDLYEKILKSEEFKWNNAAVAQLFKIIDEEKKHYTVMENIHDFIAEYDHYLTWREFEKIKRSGIV